MMTSSIQPGSTPARFTALGDGMPGERLRLGIIERAAIGPADRRAGVEMMTAGGASASPMVRRHRNIVPKPVVETTELVVGATGIEPVTPPV